MKRITIIIFLAILVVLLALGMNGLSPAGTQQSAPTVTPVSGPSLLKHLGITNTQSSAMGRMGGQMPAAPSERKEPENLTKGTSSEPLGSMINRILSLFRSSGKLPSELLNETFVLAGSDLYRLNCQSCHGPEGKGAPPEIKSLIDPVRGTSPTLLRQRMEERGHPIEEAFARQLAASADSTLRQRLQQGGEKMPSFRHLRGDEVDALLEYLKKLAGVPNSGHKELLVTQSVARVGEHLVKGTCHICHNATGPGGGHMAMMRRDNPFLGKLSCSELVAANHTSDKTRLFRDDEHDGRRKDACFSIYHGRGIRGCLFILNRILTQSLVSFSENMERWSVWRFWRSNSC